MFWFQGWGVNGNNFLNHSNLNRMVSAGKFWALWCPDSLASHQCIFSLQGFFPTRFLRCCKLRSPRWQTAELPLAFKATSAAILSTKKNEIKDNPIVNVCTQRHLCPLMDQTWALCLLCYLLMILTQIEQPIKPHIADPNSKWTVHQNAHLKWRIYKYI